MNQHILGTKNRHVRDILYVGDSWLRPYKVFGLYPGDSGKLDGDRER